MTYNVKIGYLDGVKNATADIVKKDIEDLGVKSVKNVRVIQLYLIDAEISSQQLEAVCVKLLSDSVVQWYKASEEKNTAGKKEGPGPCGHAIEVFLKKGVTDAVGDSVRIGINDLGISNVHSVRTGVRYELEGEVTAEALEKIAQSLLANKVIQDYKII